MLDLLRVISDFIVVVYITKRIELLNFGNGHTSKETRTNKSCGLELILRFYCVLSRGFIALKIYNIFSLSSEQTYHCPYPQDMKWAQMMLDMLSGP